MRKYIFRDLLGDRWKIIGDEASTWKVLVSPHQPETSDEEEDDDYKPPECCREAWTPPNFLFGSCDNRDEWDIEDDFIRVPPISDALAAEICDTTVPIDNQVEETCLPSGLKSDPFMTPQPIPADNDLVCANNDNEGSLTNGNIAASLDDLHPTLFLDESLSDGVLLEFQPLNDDIFNPSITTSLPGSLINLSDPEANHPLPQNNETIDKEIDNIVVQLSNVHMENQDLFNTELPTDEMLRLLQ